MTVKRNIIQQSDLYKLGKWLEEKELTAEDTRESLAVQAEELINSPVTTGNIEGILNMIGKRLVNIRTMDDNQKIKILARNIRLLMLHLNVPVSTELEHLC